MRIKRKQGKPGLSVRTTILKKSILQFNITMTELRIREIRGNLIQQKSNSVVVDAWFNERLFAELSSGRDVQGEQFLICVHWNHTSDSRMELSSVVLKPREHWNSFYKEFALFLDSGSDNFTRFVTSAFRDLRVELLYVSLCPITFTVRHANLSLVKDSPQHWIKLEAIFKELITKLTSKDVKLEILPLKSTAPLCMEGELQCSLILNQSTSVGGGREFGLHKRNADYLERFNRIDAELSARKQVLLAHFDNLGQQNKNICHKLSQIVELLLAPTCQSGDPEEAYVQKANGENGIPLQNERTAYTSKHTRSDVISEKLEMAMDKDARLGNEQNESADNNSTLEDAGDGEEGGPSVNLIESQSTQNNSKLSPDHLSRPGFQQVLTADCRKRTDNTKSVKGDKPAEARTKASATEADNDQVRQNVREFTGMKLSQTTPKCKFQTQPSPPSTHRKTPDIVRRSGNMNRLFGSRKLSVFGSTFNNSPYATIQSGEDKLRETIIRLDLTVVKESSEDCTKLFHQMKTILGYTLGDPWGAVMGALNDINKLVPVANSVTDTIVCIDNLSSLDTKRLKEIVCNFISGIETVAQTYGLEENICIVEMSQKSRILHPLSTDYDSLRNAVDSMGYGGYASSIEGLFVTLAALGKGSVCSFDGNLQVPPRIIVVTDGIIGKQVSSVHQEPTEIFFTYLRELAISFVTENSTCPIIIVPVRFGKKEILMKAADVCNGSLVEDITSLCSYQSVQRLSAQILKYLASEWNMWTTRKEKANSVVQVVSAALPAEDREQLLKTINEYFSSNQNVLAATDVFDNIHMRGELVPLGTRVVSGPDMKRKNGDGDWTGTIINHGSYIGTVWVLWDHGPCRLCRYGSGDCYDVLITDDKARLPGQGEIISIGMQVERGPHWQHLYSNEDGGPGSYGTVIRKSGSRVVVIWKNQSTFQYVFGENGWYDISIRDPKYQERSKSPRLGHHTAMETSCFYHD